MVVVVWWRCFVEDAVCSCVGVGDEGKRVSFKVEGIFPFEGDVFFGLDFDDVVA